MNGRRAAGNAPPAPATVVKRLSVLATAATRRARPAAIGVLSAPTVIVVRVATNVVLAMHHGRVDTALVRVRTDPVRRATARVRRAKAAMSRVRRVTTVVRVATTDRVAHQGRAATSLVHRSLVHSATAATAHSRPGTIVEENAPTVTVLVATTSSPEEDRGPEATTLVSRALPVTTALTHARLGTPGRASRPSTAVHRVVTIVLADRRHVLAGTTAHHVHRIQVAPDTSRARRATALVGTVRRATTGTDRIAGASVLRPPVAMMIVVHDVTTVEHLPVPGATAV